MRMVRAFIGAAVVTCVAALAPGLAQAATTSSSAELTDYACQQTIDPLFRVISVTAVMRPVTGTQGMRMRFDLLESKAAHGHYHAVRGHNLARWLVPSPDTLGQRPGDVWKVSHPVAPLTTPAFYRLKVTFRWLGSGSQRLAQIVRLTSTCNELGPDLLPVRVTSLTAGTYVVTIRNRGLIGAGSFDVALTTPDGATVTRAVLFLGRHKSKLLRFRATACTAGQSVTVTVDPAGAVLDYDRGNNTVTVPCPTSTSG